LDDSEETMLRRIPILILPLLAACGASAMKDQKPIGKPNPASVYCVELGGTLEIRDGDRGAVGYCHLPDGRVVEEWELFRSAHP
jgi:putative hemolysin